MDVRIVERAAIRCFGVRHLGPYAQIPQAFQKLDSLVHRAGLVGRPGSLLIAIYHDDPLATPAAELRSDAAISVAEDAALPAGLVEQRLPPARYATTTFVGPYERLGNAWSRLKGEWLSKSGERAGTSPSYEIYRNTPADVPQEKLVTELYLPLT
ncbi:MAG TPA: GyrI-like domain-containing protein [Polyangiaceae bacterium]|jgi:AraC family transcriptional regulator|nr:GyrI-like domain-containing protein [Polyangiaceae bacterium]